MDLFRKGYSREEFSKIEGEVLDNIQRFENTGEGEKRKGIELPISDEHLDAREETLEAIASGLEKMKEMLGRAQIEASETDKEYNRLLANAKKALEDLDSFERLKLGKGSKRLELSDTHEQEIAQR